MSKTKAKAVEFHCRAPEAQTVQLAGTFNDWNSETTPLTKGEHGDWAASLDLPPGRHEFKFVVDGQWCCEPGCDGTDRECPKCVPNSFGTMNRFIDVE